MNPTSYYKKAVKHFSIAAFEQAHAQAVVKHLKELHPTPPAALTLAGHFHDIDRSTSKRVDPTKDTNYQDNKQAHATNCAQITKEFLQELPQTLLQDISYLIQHHEQGPPTQEPLLDNHTRSFDLNQAAHTLFCADKLAFFSQAIHRYAKRGDKRLRMKIRFSLQQLPKKHYTTIKNYSYPQEIQKIIEEEIKTKKDT